MKTLHKLLTGTLFVALTAFGLTALTSSSSNSADTRVLGFLNETCDSEDLILFQNMIDLLNFNGTEMYGITWTFKSYINVSDYEVTDDPTCNLMSEFLAMPEVSVVKPKPKIIPADPPPGNPGGGSGGGGGQQPAPKPKPEVEFDNQNARELKNCIANKLDKLDLKKAEEVKKKKHLGCFVKLEWDLKFKKTDFSWRADQSTLGPLGITHYTNTIEGNTVPDNTVFLYPVAIKNRVNSQKWKRAGVTFDNLSEFVALEEMVHTIQGHNAKQANSNWKNPEPYEQRDWQIQANVVANVWYYQLKGDKNAPISMYDTNAINKHRDGNCDLTGTFLKNKNNYIKYVEQLKNKNLTQTERETIEANKAQMKEYFDNDLLKLQNYLSPIFDKTEKLNCSQKEKLP